MVILYFSTCTHKMPRAYTVKEARLKNVCENENDQMEIWGPRILTTIKRKIC
jgi:hypothetical protein